MNARLLELLSAQLDGALTPAEEDELLRALSQGSASEEPGRSLRTARERLRRAVRSLREDPERDRLLLQLSPAALTAALTALEGRLAAAVRDELAAPEPAALPAPLRAALRGAGPLVRASEADFARLDQRLAALVAEELVAEEQEQQAGRAPIEVTPTQVTPTQVTPTQVTPVQVTPGLAVEGPVTVTPVRVPDAAPPRRVLAGGAPAADEELQLLSEVRGADAPEPPRALYLPGARPRLDSGANRVARTRRWLSGLTAAAALLATTFLVYKGGEQVVAMFGRGRTIPDDEPRPVPSRSPAQTPSASPSAWAHVPSPTPSAPRPIASPLPGPSLGPSPVPGPSLGPSPSGPEVAQHPEQTPTPAVSPEQLPSPSPSGDPGGTRVRPSPSPSPQRPVETDIAGLREELRRIQDPRTPGDERARRVEGLARPSFDLPEAYAFLERVLLEKGLLDRLEGASGARRAAFLALGRFGTARGARALLDAPLRRAQLEADAAALRAAVVFLREPAAIALLATGVGPGAKGEQLDERRLAVIEGLADLRRPEATTGLLALYAARSVPDEVRREAARAAGACGDERALGPLLEGVRGGDEGQPRGGWRLRQGAAWGLGGLSAGLVASQPDDSAACVAALGSAAQIGRDPRVEEAAVQALGRSRSRAAVEPLLEVLERHPRAALRKLAHRALCYLAGRIPPGVRTAEEWRAFWARVPAGALPRAPRRAEREAADRTVFRAAPAGASEVVFLVDASGSLALKWELVQFELREALARCGEEVSFQLVFFSDAPKPLWPQRRLQRATARAKAEALAFAERQVAVAAAQTGLARALRDVLLSYPQADAIYLISDGQVSEDEAASLPARVERWNHRRPRRAAIHAIHLREPGDPVREEPRPPLEGAPGDVALMHRLAWENDGFYAHN
ncbi:MAG: hypothetical protein AB7N76_21435 [Planctomycetota bacterium]